MKNASPIMPGAGRCPKCGSRQVVRVDMPSEIAGRFYAGTLEKCCNPACGAMWEPFDPAQLLDVDMPKTSSFREPCDNCAFRPESVEQRDPETWKAMIAELKAGVSFHCHKGVPLDPGGEDGFAYPRSTDGKPHRRKLRTCRGYLNMMGTIWDRRYGTPSEDAP